MSDEYIQDENKAVKIIFEHDDIESSEEPPATEWSSLICLTAAPEFNAKRLLYEQGLYEPPSAEICNKYLKLSDSSIYRHPLYPYPAILDPGIEDALLEPVPPVIYPDDGQELYLSICKEMNEAPCKIFYNGLLTPHINLSYYCVSPMGFRAMALALKKNKTVQSIDFTYNFISLDGCYHFGDIFFENTTLKEINFYGCRMGSEGIKRLVNKFPLIKGLKKINLGSNELKDEGVKFLSEAIYKGASVTNINLSYNSLTAKSADNLAQALEINNQVTHLNLSWNNIAIPKYVELLASYLKESDHFVEIDLSWNSLSNRFTRAITYILEAKNLKVLKLNNNNLNDTAITAIGTCLPNCKKLTTLDLSSNPLTLKDAKTLLRYMAQRRVKLVNLLLDDVYVDEAFILSRSKVLDLKFRKDAVITHGLVKTTIAVAPPDLREVVLRRSEFVCSKPKKNAVDVPLMLLELNKRANGEPIMEKSLVGLFRELGAFQINDELAEAFSIAFPGPKRGKIKTCNFELVAEYVKRKRPDAQLPVSPPPKAVPRVEAKPKGKDAGKGKDARKGKKK